MFAVGLEKTGAIALVHKGERTYLNQMHCTIELSTAMPLALVLTLVLGLAKQLAIALVRICLYGYSSCDSSLFVRKRLCTYWAIALEKLVLIEVHSC